MNNFIEECIADSDCFADDSPDEQRILKSALAYVLPLVINNELTKRQSLCLRLSYVHGKTQMQIARELKISQPTVNKHITSAKRIVEKIMIYCFYAVKKANEQWINTD